ncbi:MAG: nucleotidyl transferase AbiEii/AbiGii toxin family protein [Lachnospiraceae bacterium]|nr:nucleotidyl transferase AbiEii/AbiGii toxin family protein [Lachnospiraceae bacterium]
MAFSQAQVKGKIKKIAKESKADARILMRIYMMERFLERIANSSYSEEFIIKGGILVTSMVGVSMRSTMDIDTSIRNFELSGTETERIVKEICSVDLDDNVSFVIKEVSRIMDDMEYPGIRLALDSMLGEMVTPIKIDISTGDVITPRAIEYDYRLMLEERSIKLWSYNLETVLAEKLQTILVRGILNTRMRDFYDLYTLLLRYEDSIDHEVFKQAFQATCQKRNSNELAQQGVVIIDRIASDEKLISLWKGYQKKYFYAADISYESVVESVRKIYALL